MTAENDLIRWLQENGYNGKSRGHIDYFFERLVEDLLEESEIIREAAGKGEIAYTRNFSLGGPEFLGDVDLILGPPKVRQSRLTDRTSVIREEEVESVWAAVDFEALMSCVDNNWKNRGRDIHSFYMEVYDRHPVAVTAAVLLFNPDDVEGETERILDSYRDFDFGEGGLKRHLDAMAVIPVADGQSYTRADILGNELNYDHLLEVLVTGIEDRLQGNLDITPETLDSLTAYGESERLEFKSKMPGHKETLAKDAVAIANNAGGRIVLGVDDETQEVVGLENPGETEERIANLLDQRIDVDIINEISTARIKGKTIIEVKIERVKRAPASMGGTFYTRTGTTRKKLDGYDILDEFPRS